MSAQLSFLKPLHGRMSVREPTPCTEYSSLPPHADLVLATAMCIKCPPQVYQVAAAALYLPDSPGKRANISCHRATAVNACFRSETIYSHVAA